MRIRLRFDNGRMRDTQRAFKDTQIFGWEVEPRDERPSDFVQSTGYSALSGYYAIPDTRGAASRRYSQRRGLNSLVLVGSLIVVLSIAALYGLAHLLRG